MEPCNKESNTPLTDERALNHTITAEFARTLERRAIAAEQERDVWSQHCQEWQTKLAEARERIAVLERVCNRAANWLVSYPPGGNAFECREEMLATLAGTPSADPPAEGREETAMSELTPAQRTAYEAAAAKRKGNAPKDDIAMFLAGYSAGSTAQKAQDILIAQVTRPMCDCGDLIAKHIQDNRG